MDKTPAQQLILEAVVTCIEKYGIDKLTTRKIAKEAGTNIASINYYFRSKEHLVSEALTMTINHMKQDVIAAIDEPGLPFQERLENVFFYLIEGGVRFQGITTAHLYSAVVEKRYDSPGAQGINEIFDQLAQRAALEYPQHKSEDIQFLLSQIFGSILFIMLAPNFFSLPQKYQPISPENCRGLAERFARIFFNSL
jgi:AcrR family transcriptional regulator